MITNKNSMERREDALREALTDNTNETTRWQTYKQENEAAIENLENFAKRLTLEVMVPVGRKAFMPGTLIHTNEVLVGHFQGYFSKCSGHKAKEICQLRLRTAAEQLKRLEKEAQLWQNKLNEPYMQGALPTAEEREIIEPYDEQQEQEWKKKHRESIKRFKIEEREARNNSMSQTKDDVEVAALLDELGDDLGEMELTEELLNSVIGDNKPTKSVEVRINETAHKNGEKTSEDIMKMLEALETKEERLNELEQVEANSDETMSMVHKLMSGELQTTNSKVRLTHRSKTQKQEIRPDASKSQETNCNENTPLDEVASIRKESQYLSLEDRIGFYKFQIQILQEKLREINNSGSERNKEKLIDVVVSLMDDLDEMQDQWDSDEKYSDTEDKSTDLEVKNVPNDKEKHKNRRISFALSDETLEFRRNETVAEMLPKSEIAVEKPKRDIITLDNPVASEIAVHHEISNATLETARKQTILDKVAQSREHVAEHQSEQDFDLVNQILDAMTKKSRTLNITFKHSDVTVVEQTDITCSDEVPQTPADFYTQYLKAKTQLDVGERITTDPIYVNAYEGEQMVKTPLLRESQRDAAYEDPRKAFSTPDKMSLEQQKETGNSSEFKSILRNKSAVENETHHENDLPKKEKINKKQKRKPRAREDEFENMSAYNKVMGEVTEKVINEPEPLPKGKFIDANAPKKRISRFRQSGRAFRSAQTDAE